MEMLINENTLNKIAVLLEEFDTGKYWQRVGRLENKRNKKMDKDLKKFSKKFPKPVRGIVKGVGNTINDTKKAYFDFASRARVMDKG